MTDTIADQLLSGFLCQECMAPIDADEPGHPRSCPTCQAARQAAKVRRATASKKHHRKNYKHATTRGHS